VADQKSERVKLVYNAYMSAPSGRVLDYLLNNPHFTSRQGRQKAIDAIAAFYRPIAEEARDEMSPSEIQEVARQSVMVLVNHIESLCTRYEIDSPIAKHSGGDGASAQNLGQIEVVLADGLRAIASAIKTGGLSSMTEPVTPENTVESQEESPSAPPLSLDQGVVMDGNELGELGVLFDDEETFNDMAA
jgi:hypothetical protein